MASSNSADVVVVGSGVCGAMVAHEAAQAGLSVLMLEAGPRGERGDYWKRFMSLPANNRARGDMQSPFPQSPYAPFPDVRQRRLPDPERPRRRCVPASLSACCRRHDVALVGPVLAAPAGRSAPEEHLRCRARLAIFLRRASSLTT